MTPRPVNCRVFHPMTRVARRGPSRFRPFRFTLKLLAFVTVVYFATYVVVPGVREAAGKLRTVNPALLLLGLVLEIAALFATRC